MRITWVCCTEILPALALSLLQKILGVEKNLFRVCPSRGGAGHISVVAARAPKGATASFNPVQPGSGASVWAGTAEVKGKMRMWRKGWRNGSESRELTGKILPWVLQGAGTTLELLLALGEEQLWVLWVPTQS